MSQSTPALPPRFRDVEYVAEGAFGHVYRATGPDGEALAVKVLAPGWLGDAEAVWRFTGEYRRLAALDHPAFPRAVDEGLTSDGRPFFAMTFLPGRPLDALAPLGTDRARAVLARVAEALAYLHGVGLAHGDLKAANVLLADDDSVYLLDVGTAAPLGQRREGVEGTPEYMAPEVLRQAEVAPEGDWYALGVLGYLLVTGQPPFVAGDGGAAALVRAQLFSPPAPLPAEVVGRAPALAGAVMALLEKDAARRGANVDGAIAALGATAGQARTGLLGGAWVPRAAVARAWERLAAPDGPDLLVLEGSPGAGKSRALDALRLDARLQGATWIAASCGGAGEAPGSVARLVLRQALSAAGLPAGDHVLAWLAGGLPTDWLDLEPRARKLSLFGALAEAWSAATGALGNVIVGLDDWHTADALSRDIVDHLRRAPGGRRARWCAAGEPGHGLAGAELVTLPDWQPEEVRTLVASRLGTQAPEALVAALVAVEANRPGMVNALLEHWVAAGSLRRAAAGWTFAPDATATERDPWTRLWAERLARLPAEALGLARLAGAAYAAGPVPPRALGRALGLDDVALQRALDALLAAGVLAQTAVGVRLAVASRGPALGLELGERKPGLLTRLARLVLDLDPEHTVTPPDPTLEATPLPVLVAATRLAGESDDDGLAVALAGVAARRSLEHLSLDDALKTLAGARDRLTDAIPAARRLALYQVGGEAARLADRLDEAARDLERALALAEETADAAAAAQALHGLAKFHQLRGQYSEALDYARRAEQMAERAGRPGLGARSAILRARVELYTAGQEAAQASCARAVALAAAGNTPTLRSAALNLQGVLLVQVAPDRRDEALGMIREALALAEGVGDLIGVAAALENLGNTYVALGELREARDAFARDADHCRAHGIGTEGLSADMNLSRTLAELGEVEAAATLGDDVATRAAAAGRTYLRSVARAAAGQAAWRGGRIVEAFEALDEALALACSIENKYAEVYLRLDRLEAYMAAGELASARTEAQVVGELGKELGLPEVGEKLGVLRAEMARVGGDLAEAEVLAEPYTQVLNRAVVLAAHGVLGRVQLDAGLLEDARRHFELAAAIARSWHAPWHLAAARLGLALSSEDPSEAVAQAREAVAPNPNPYARAGAACVLAASGSMDAASRQALEELMAALSGLPADARDRVLAAQGLPEAATLDGLRRRLPDTPPGGVAGVTDLAAWHEAVTCARDEGAVNQALLSGLIALAQADRGYLLGYERGRLQEVVTLGVDYAEEVSTGFSSSIAEEALFSGEPIYLVDAAADDRWREAQSVQNLGLRTVVALPYAVPGQILGVVYMDRLAIDPILGEDAIAGLKLLANAAATRVVALRREAAGQADLAFERLLGRTAIAIAARAGEDARGALVEAALSLTGAMRGFWLGRQPDGSWSALAVRDRDGQPVPFAPQQISQSVLSQAVEEGEGVCLIETDRPETWKPGQSLLALGIRMVWCVPVGEGAREALYIDTTRLDAVDPRALLGRIERMLERFAVLFGEAAAPLERPRRT